jgi:hypothetical protein
VPLIANRRMPKMTGLELQRKIGCINQRHYIVRLVT